MNIEDEEIRLLAHELWTKAGCPDGNDQGFWFAAEQDLIQRKQKEVSREEAEASSLATIGSIVVR